VWFVTSDLSNVSPLGQAYGSVETLLEEQHGAPEAYTHSCKDRRRYMKGMILLVAKKDGVKG
jgi:hypothetical protein